MNEEATVMENQKNHEIIRDALIAQDRTNRWLIERLKEHDIFWKDTQISNRLSGYIEFKNKELKAINKILKLKLKFD